MKHRIDRIVIHCSATKSTQDYSFEQLERDHRLRGFRECGYNFYVRKDGSVHEGRNVGDELAHATGYNRNSIAICYEGGLNEMGMACDTRTDEQKDTLLTMIRFFHALYSGAEVLGHNDLPMVNKDCPCFDVKKEYELWVQ